MTSRAKARAARIQALLNDDGTITPAARLPDGLLVQEMELEAQYLEALTAFVTNNSRKVKSVPQ
ncbi:hypothetical protein [Deinococcus marmoris]|uniref:hypothetical protein n=1 Tax=Deinococcus marmoris TaxID=249408 RepID=UPI0012DE74C8|nr:hypothetical protein [Deinococcus marmoris]